MQKQALVTAEIAQETQEALNALGYQVALAGWGQTRQALSEAQLAGLVGRAALLMVEVEEVPASVIEAAPELEVIHVCRAQAKTVDVPAATSRHIAVLCSPGRNAESVADFTLGMMISLARQIHLADRHLRTQGWYVGEEIPYFHFRGPELAGRTLGMIGCGAIGQALLRRLSGFEMRVLIYDPFLDPGSIQGFAELASLEETLAAADFLLVLCALTPETTGMIDAAALRRMKPSAYLINTARAAVVDEAALLAALQRGRLAGAALDVFWHEPLPPDSPWLVLDQVLLTPHLGGAALDVARHHGQMLIEDLRTLHAGEVPRRLVNPEVLESWRARVR